VSDELDRCHAAALRILRYRFNSAAELRRKLASKKFENEVIETTLARLRDETWLDDDRYAAAYVRTRAQKRIGRLRIRRELIAAGVDDDTAQRAIGENVDRDAEAALLRKEYEKLVARLGAEQREKIAARLVRRGFDAGAVRALLR
jgi:regulatory protein